MKGEGSSEGGELTQQGAGREGDEGGCNIQCVRLQEQVGKKHFQGALKILGNAFSTQAAGFSRPERYLSVIWDKPYATWNLLIQKGFFQAFCKLWC